MNVPRNVQWFEALLYMSLTLDAVGSVLDLTPEEYRASGATLQEITGFRTRVIGRQPIETRYPRTISYAIRRCEFDDFLLRRSGAHVFGNTPVSSIHRSGERWVVNDRFEAPVIVGAGGHFCPVARHMRGGHREGSRVPAEGSPCGGIR